METFLPSPFFALQERRERKEEKNGTCSHRTRRLIWFTSDVVILCYQKSYMYTNKMCTYSLQLAFSNLSRYYETSIEKFQFFFLSFFVLEAPTYSHSPCRQVHTKHERVITMKMMMMMGSGVRFPCFFSFPLLPSIDPSENQWILRCWNMECQ